jgi:predicted negative regulator of RcsB-dependent stress response
MTRTGEAARPTVEDHTESFVEWAQDHTRELSFGALAIVTIAAAAWLYGYSSRQNLARAEGLLAQAGATLGAQRTAEAQAQLERLVDGYEGTPPAGQGLLRLGQVLYEQGKFEDGVRRLEAGFADYDDGPFAASIRQLAAAGYEQLGQPAKAAELYSAAAGMSSLEAERDALLARSARAWANAGNEEEAIRIWTPMAEEPDHPLGNEARITIGELTAVPAGTATGG